MAELREITVEQLMAGTTDAFVRHQVDPAMVHRVWARGKAVVISGGRGRPGEKTSGPVFTCVGPTAALRTLMQEVAAVAAVPWRVTNESRADADVPRQWHRPAPRSWHWMLTDALPPETDAGRVEVIEVTDHDRIDAVLDESNADSFARPGSAGVESWLGAVRNGDLVAVGALMRLPDGTGHLRGIGVLPAARGTGVGTSLSAALTRLGMSNGASVCTLGVYTDNAVAVRMYERLGYQVVHTFTSGAVEPSKSEARTVKK